MQECFSKIAKTRNEYCGDCLFDKDDVASMVAIAKIFMNKDNVVLSRWICGGRSGLEQESRQ